MTGQPPGRWALAVGINEYPSGPRRSSGANDVLLIKEILQHTFGFLASRIRQLLGREATLAAIRAEIDALLHDAAPGDVVVAYFSGLATLHPRADGSQQSVLLAVDSVDAEGDIAEAITSEELHD